ncbi:MAG TPA: dynamin family protein, partial [Thermoanaerobaculia bacterium]
MRRNDQDDAPRAAPAGAGDPDAGDPDAPLGSYWRAKHAVAQLLRDAARALGTGAAGASGAPGPSAVGALLDELKARLAEDRFQLVVLGQFKRGKSSLMNAILGRPLLPTGIVPVTTAVTAVRHGARGRALVRRADRALVEEVPLAALPEFVTEAGNPGNRKQVLSVTVEAPAAFLRRGLCFVDTPGVGSALDQNTAATLAFLPEADAAIFVTSADGPLSGAELDLLDQVHGHVQRLFFVLNKIDQVPDEQRAELVSYTSGLLARHLGVEAVRLFPLSATQALAAEPGSRQALASGLPALEAALATLLGDDRQTVFLVSVLDHAIAAFAEARLELARRVDERLPAPGEAGAEHGQGA